MLLAMSTPLTAFSKDFMLPSGNVMFTKAKSAYERYRDTLLPDDTENMAFVDQEIAACNNAPALMAKPVKYSIERNNFV